MENTIKTENGIITINSVPKHYKIEEYDERFDIINVEYSSNTFVLGQEAKIENLFKEYEPQIIQIIKFKIAEPPEFYRHFDFDINLKLNSDYVRITPINSRYCGIRYPKFLKVELKRDSFEYLKGLKND
jgi:hypothetical protein